MFANHDCRTGVTNLLFYLCKGPESKCFTLYWPCSSCCNYSDLHCGRNVAMGNALMSDPVADLQTLQNQMLAELGWVAVCQPLS